MNRKVLDIAVLSQQYSELFKDENSNIIELDETPINLEIFKKLFFPFGENFSINKSLLNLPHIHQLISLSNNDKKINTEPFYLYDSIISNIEQDLQMSRDCFTTESLMNLSNELNAINSIIDLPSSTLLSSLPWSEIDKQMRTSLPNSIFILVISIVFKTATLGVKDTIIKIPYSINK